MGLLGKQEGLVQAERRWHANGMGITIDIGWGDPDTLTEHPQQVVAHNFKAGSHLTVSPCC